MLTRRELLAAGGLALAGRVLFPGATGGARRREEVVVAMRSAGQGARVWFEPAGVLVRPGTRVRWIVGEGVHTTTAYHPSHGGRPLRIPDGARPWDSGHLTSPDDSFEVIPEAEGVYDYFCRPHEAAGMVGRIVVASGRSPDPEASRFRPPSGDGELPPAAREAFPPVAEIVREGRVDVPAGGPGAGRSSPL